MEKETEYLPGTDISDVNKKEAEKIIGDLRDEINKHNYYYYIKDAPVITDSES